MLWRSKGSDEPGQGAYVALAAQKYERPAQSALSEFAPENRFYANQRRVEIDQINMGLAKTEDWRLCPSCHHMENLEVEPDMPPDLPALRRSDVVRRRAAAHAAALPASDREQQRHRVRIDDSAEDREPKFYVRQLLADFEPTDIREAWQLRRAATPFGFEFIARVTFRDVNFGELGKPGDAFKVAGPGGGSAGLQAVPALRQGADSQRDAGRPRGPAGPQLRLRQARDRRPRATCSTASTSTASSSRRRCASSCPTPDRRGRAGGPVVHGGAPARAEAAVWRHGRPPAHDRCRTSRARTAARASTTSCSTTRCRAARATCISCWRRMHRRWGTCCAWRSTPSRAAPATRTRRRTAATAASTSTAWAQHGAGVARHRPGRPDRSGGCARATWSGSTTISDIYINPNFDSALEARFIESLKKLGGVGGLPPVKLVQDIVYGKSGYLLEVGGQRYRVEPQVELSGQRWRRPCRACRIS